MPKRKAKSKPYTRRGSEAALALQAHRGALGRAAAARVLIKLGQRADPTPPKTMEKSINHIRDSVLKLIACIEGKKALDGIADVLDKYGQSLDPETKAQLVNAGEQLWDSLVRLGCPV